MVCLSADRNAEVVPAAHGLAAAARGRERPLLHCGNDCVVEGGAGL